MTRTRTRTMATGLVSAPLLACAPAFAMTAQTQATPKPATAMGKSAVMATGDRATDALNALEAAGYRSIADLHPEGRNIAADAARAGMEHAVIVTPSGKITPQV